jgi:hypothetical protein
MELEGKKIHRGNAAQFYVAAELSRRNIVAAITLGNCPTTDILCTRADGEGFAHVQVKTFRKGGRSCSVGMKAERSHGVNFFWILVGIPHIDDDAPVFYVIPSDEMATHVKQCFDLWVMTPGRDGQPHDKSNSIRSVRVTKENRDGWRIDDFEGRWDLIETKLGMASQRNVEGCEEADETDEDLP